MSDFDFSGISYTNCYILILLMIFYKSVIFTYKPWDLLWVGLMYFNISDSLTTIMGLLGQNRGF